MCGDEAANPFSLLANETRLGVVEAIGNASGGGEYATLSHSTVQEALGGVDSGKLNYHLRQLRGRFVERTDDGYRLTLPGIRVYQALVSGAFDGERPSVEPVELEHDCETCGDPMTVSYEQGRFFVRCPTCDVVYQRYPISPNAVDESDAQSLLDVSMWTCHIDTWTMLRGICPYCSGAVERTFSPEDRVGTNNDDWDLFAYLSCRSCGWFNHVTAEMVALHHHATTTFYDERGLSEQYMDVKLDSEWTVTVHSEDPLRARVEITHDGDTIRFLLDEHLEVVDWSVDGERPHRSGATPRRRRAASDDPAPRSRMEASLSILADETRLAIVEVLGDAGGGGEDAALPYSTIRDRLATGDTGNLSYHLKRLRGRFVDPVDEGYRLTISGIRAYQAVASGRFERDRPTVEPTPFGERCAECDGLLQASYLDGRFIVRCNGCSVRWFRYPLSPNAFDPDDVQQLVEAAFTRNYTDLRSMFAGICPYCSSGVARTVSGSDRGEMGVDEDTVFAHLSCLRCSWFALPRVDMVAFLHHATATYFERHGRPKPSAGMIVDGEWTTTVRSEDPLRVQVDIELDGDTLHHVVDEDLQVVEWTVLD
ncbi:DUF7351 domain-containing protein [Halomarina oriensis]|uniref:ArsR family transcriptional regulator n=1 Tax=Halomarina oriensis TaxID=671145 RepID=A0A6B0GLR0_9EURY|nr:hypothetical protein [Halomarina oriensis]MWG33713.1 hypothetical protein [Halomarina oriensis]